MFGQIDDALYCNRHTFYQLSSKNLVHGAEI
nr:MAG TPA: hypothetical protein [Caudoviricetes sp.]